MISPQLLGFSCGATHLARIPSPSGKKVALVFDYNCDPADGFSTQVDLLKPGENPRGPGRVFRADDYPGSDHYPYGGPRIHIKWESDQALTISYPAKARILKKATKIEGVSITYVRE